MNAIVRMLAIYAGLSLLLCGFTHMEWSPLQPNGSGQWIALFLLIFPAAAAAEFPGRRRARVDPDESRTHTDCSWSRILLSVMLVVLAVGVVMGATWWLSHPAASTALPAPTPAWHISESP